MLELAVAPDRRLTYYNTETLQKKKKMIQK